MNIDVAEILQTLFANGVASDVSTIFVVLTILYYLGKQFLLPLGEKFSSLLRKGDLDEIVENLKELNTAAKADYEKVRDEMNEFSAKLEKVNNRLEQLTEMNKGNLQELEDIKREVAVIKHTMDNAMVKILYDNK